MEENLHLYGFLRLGVCLAPNTGQAALLAGHLVGILRQAGSPAGRDHQAGRVSHLPSHFWNPAERQWGESQGSAGTAASCQPENHNRCVHARDQLAKARGPEQAGADGFEEGWFGFGSSWFRGPYWTMTKNQHFLQALWNVGVPDKILTRVTARAICRVLVSEADTHLIAIIEGAISPFLVTSGQVVILDARLCCAIWKAPDKYELLSMKLMERDS